jgi:hypothetical protein
MSASINLVGLDKQLLCSELKKSEYFPGIARVDLRERILSGNISTADFIELYYYLSGRGITDTAMKPLGMEFFFEMVVKRYCFELAQMFGYYFEGFQWDGEVKLEHTGPDYVLQRADALGVVRWFDALSRVFSGFDSTGVNADYLREAKKVKTVHEMNYEYFSGTEDLFREVEQRILASDQHLFLWAYSF